VAPGLNRRSRQGALTFTHLLTERRSLVLQLSWLDVGYYGANSALLNLVSGYKYASISAGEKFSVAPTTALTVSAFDNQLITPLSIGNSRESGLRLDFQHSFTERTSLKAFVGASQQSLESVRRNGGESQGSLQAENSIGALGGFTLSLATLRGHLDLDYANLLQPYSAGVLAQRQSLTLSDTQALNEKLNVTLAAARIQNNHSAVLLGIDRAFYDTVTLGLEWQYAEHWYLRTDVGGTRTQTTLYSSQPDQPVNEWRVALSLRWTPLPMVRTF
jgi:hypothetical protein